MGNKELKSASFLKGILNFTWVMFVFLIASSIHINVTSGDNMNFIALQIVLLLTFAFFMLSIIMNLRRIILSVLNKNPFIDQNVVRFRRIGYNTLILAIAGAIMNGQNDTGTKIIHIKPIFSLNPELLLTIIFGVLALVLAEVFRMALEIKNENDLTI